VESAYGSAGVVEFLSAEQNLNDSYILLHSKKSQTGETVGDREQSASHICKF